MPALGPRKVRGSLTVKVRAMEALRRLKAVNPDPRCELYYETPFQLLVSVVLSAQTTDKAVNRCMEPLYKQGFTVATTVDEWVMNSLQNYKEKPLQSIAKEDLDLDTEKEKKEKEEDLATQQKKFKDLTTQIQKALDEHIKEVKISERLVDSPVCLVSGSNDPSAHMEKILGAMGQDLPKTKRILEINPQHPIFDKMLKMAAEKQNSWAEILYNQALLNEGSPIKDPARFNKQISQLMVDA